MEYKLIALDMDGTLLNSAKEITEETRKSIETALNQGKHVVLSSGRAFAEIKDYEEQLKLLEYAILESGGLVKNLKTGENIAISQIDGESVDKIFEATKLEDCFVHIISQGRSIANKSKIDKMEYYYMGEYKPMYKRVATKVEDVLEFHKKDKKGIEKINIFHVDAAARERTYFRIKDLPLSIVFAEETSIEITPTGVTKGAGLIKLCEHLDIDLSETISVGDANNDLDILKTAGLAIAMGNANENVMKVADVVVADCDHDGVKQAIDEYFIN